MTREKMTIIKDSIEDYKKLSSDEKMFILGFMQGVLKKENMENETSVIMDKSKRVNINKTS